MSASFDSEEIAAGDCPHPLSCNVWLQCFAVDPSTPQCFAEPMTTAVYRCTDPMYGCTGPVCVLSLCALTPLLLPGHVEHQDAGSRSQSESRVCFHQLQHTLGGSTC